jgi:hypothetical protein
MGNLSALEEKVLKKIAEQHIITKLELKNFLMSNGFSDTEAADIKNIANSVTQSLVNRKYIRCINPIGSASFVVTNEGNKFSQNLK